MERRLSEYQHRRNFARTPEPLGRRRSAPSPRPRFVVQQHDASTLHYDFRVEVDGILKSWAVPKGPSLKPDEKRMARPTEDHPLEYAEFEGVIPEGEYGAGPVIVWDTGTYRPQVEDLSEAFRKGHLSVWLEGAKLTGGFALTRIRDGKDEAWLLVKKADEHADRSRDPVQDEPGSVRSGRTLADVVDAAPTRDGATDDRARHRRSAAKRHPRRSAAGKQPRVTHPDRVLFPGDGITKAEMVDYYRATAPVMVHHLRDRPLMLERFPEGIDRGGFIQKDLAGSAPDSVETVAVAKKGGTVHHPLANRPTALAALANMGTLTFHTWLSRADRIDHPDRLIFDLDPPTEDFREACTAALWLRDLLAELDLVPFVKTTGKRGLHVVVPLRRGAGFAEVRGFARAVAEVLAARHPDRLTTAVRKNQRQGRLFVDVLRNGYAQTAVAPYSLRAANGGPVAMPLWWEELTDTGCHPTRFTLHEVPRRLEKLGDPWATMGRRARSLVGPRGRLGELAAELPRPRS